MQSAQPLPPRDLELLSDAARSDPDAARSDPGAAARHAHTVQFYDGDAFLVGALERFVGDGLQGGEAAVVLATTVHLEALADRLRARGLDLAALATAGRYAALDAAELSSRIVVDGWPDERRFVEVVGSALLAARDGGRPVRVFGELVALLWAEGRRDAALRLEDLWNQLGETHSFSLLCGYPMSGFGRASDRAAFAHVCEAHGGVRPAESWAAESTPDRRDRELAALQQKARALEAEIEERRALEAARARLAHELELRVEELASAHRRKDEFLATLAHELRNPLAPMRMALKLARTKPAETARYLGIIDRQAENLAHLVDDLLDVSRITHGKIELRPEPLEVAPLVARAVDATRHLLDERRHELSVALPPEPLRVRGDATRLEQVLVNLLTNAAKYTPRGGRVWLEAARTGENDDAVELRVRDDGIGISPELLPRVFDIFEQAERTLDRSQGGLGIGLTVARKLVELHGGAIEARSAGADQGTEIVIRLPASAGGAVARRREPLGTSLGALRVLVVDDNSDAGDLLADRLREDGHDVHVVRSGEAALAADAELQPELVLLDLGMPGMDGFEVARRLRAGGSRAQIVAVSGYGQPRDRERTAAAGFAGHLLKPVRDDALLRVIEELQAAVGTATGEA